MTPGGKDPRRAIQGMRSRAQGNQFEQQVLNACVILSQHGEAAIDKTPEPMKPLAPPNAYGQFKACYTKKAEPDFHGTIAGGRAILFEAKSTATGKLEQSRVLKEQGDTMDKYTALGAHCFVLATFDGVRAYRVPWMHWKTMRERWGRKYVTEEDLSRYRVPFASGFTYAITADIPTPENIGKGPAATLGDILTAFCGLPYGAEPDGDEWHRAYSQLTEMLYSLSTLTEESVENIVERLDRIDIQNGEV